MKFKEQPRSNLEPERAERDDVHVATNRCPFCHEGVSVETQDWVACWKCQARHHRECWQESTGCGSCGETRFVAETTAALDSKNSTPRSTKIATVAAAACFVAAIGLVLADVVFEVMAVDSLLVLVLVLTGVLLKRRWWVGASRA